jgi:hypothetical protein
MGSVADKIAWKVAVQIRSNVINLAEFWASRELAREAGLDGSRMRELIAEGHDPAFAFYAQNLTLVSLFAEAISAMPEAKSYVNSLAKVEDIRARRAANQPPDAQLLQHLGVLRPPVRVEP